MIKALMLAATLVAPSSFAAAQSQAPHKLAFERDNAIWLANIDGTGAKKLAEGQSPDLSPDGTKLAYNTVQAEGQPAHRQIAVLDLASGKTTILKDIPSDNCMDAQWSPDGSQILFDFYTNDERRIGVVNADGTGFRDTQAAEPKAKSYWSETWAADGKSFFAQDMESLYLLDLNAKVLKKWPIEKIVPHGGMSGDVRLHASPDGKVLLMDVEMDETARDGWDGPPASIWTLDLATEKASRLTPKSLYAWDCHWLNYPGSILCVSEKPGSETQWICRMSTSGHGGDLKPLVKEGRGPCASP